MHLNDAEHVAAAFYSSLFHSLAVGTQGSSRSFAFHVYADGHSEEDAVLPTMVAARVYSDVLWDSDEDPLPEVPRNATQEDRDEFDSFLRSITLEAVAARYERLRGGWVMESLSIFPEDEVRRFYRKLNDVLDASALVDFSLIHAKCLRRYSDGDRVFCNFGRDHTENQSYCILSWRQDDIEGFDILKDFVEEMGLVVENTP